MSILIKGMKMPTSCVDCSLGGSLCCHLLPGIPALWAEYTNAVREKRRHSDCPLVSVPPHGRLIEEPKEFEYGGLAFIAPLDFKATAEYFANQVKAQPTVIEAEEDQDE